ncbi:unnamed protein product [Lactuca saligna]|uniref:RRM domain-containing protein n=1 Tax=Lactuca saligna TaxID=75948 RepID=A0AA35YMN2_LACSI|nr:unnamed protein product [Lactuca saligna]
MDEGGKKHRILIDKNRLQWDILEHTRVLVSSSVSFFYITNFPNSVQLSDRWRVCGRLGQIINVFISRKLSRMGKRFGFIRFVGVISEDNMIKKLCDVWFGSHKLFASTSHLPKDDSILNKRGGSSNVMKPILHDQSYASVVKGSSYHEPSNVKKDEVIDLYSGDFIVEKKRRVCLVKARDFLTLPNLFFPIVRVSDVVSKHVLIPNTVASHVSVLGGQSVFESKQVPTSRLAAPSPIAESPADGVVAPAFVPTGSHVASFSAIPSFSTRPNGFSGGFGHMEGVHFSEDSLTHPSGFSNELFVRNDTISDGSVYRNCLLIEANKALELGEKIGFNMNECYSHIKSVIKGEVFNNT